MSKKEELKSKSTGEAASISDFHQRFGSSGERINSLSGVVEQNRPTSSMISQSSLMSTVLQPGNMERPLRIDGGRNMVGVTTTGGDDDDEQVVRINSFKFVKAVKDKFQDQEKYLTFLQVFKDFKDQRIDPFGLIAKVIDLLKGHDDLLLDFNAFLPKECQITLLPEDEVDDCVSSELTASQFSSNKTNIVNQEAASVASDAIDSEETGDSDEPVPPKKRR